MLFRASFFNHKPIDDIQQLYPDSFNIVQLPAEVKTRGALVFSCDLIIPPL